MTKRRRCEDCGCFLRRPRRQRYYGSDGTRLAVPVYEEFGNPMCHVCALVGMTSQQVRWDDDEERGYDAEGESLNAIEHRSFLDPWYGNRTASARALANSTEDTRATSRWLPNPSYVNRWRVDEILNGASVFDLPASRLVE